MHHRTTHFDNGPLMAAFIDRPVLVFGGDAVGGSFMDLVRDPQTGFYFDYASPGDEEHDEEFLQLLAATHDEVPTPRLVTAIIDTGMLHEHPLINGRILQEVDFTGEGTEDLSGHGTIVTLISIRGAVSKFIAGLLNIKVARRDGRGTREDLIRGLNWLASYKHEHPELKITANLSAGFYSRRFLGLLPCDGNCDVCKAAVDLTQAGVFLLAAVGNLPGKTACPATVGLKRPDVGVLAVTLFGSPHAGIGQVGFTLEELPRPIPLGAKEMTTIAEPGQADDYMFNLAVQFEQQGDQVQAEKVYEHLHKYGSSAASRQAGVILGLRAASRGDYDVARNLLKEGTGSEVQDPDLQAQLFYTLGYIAHATGDRSATAYLEKAVQTNHVVYAPLAAHLLASARLAQNAFSDAIPYLDIATQSKDQEIAASALYNRALAKRRLGMRQSSLEDYEEASAAPSGVQDKAQLGLASMLAEEGDIAKALPLLQNASLSVNDDIRAKAFLALGDIGAAVGAPESAAHYYSLALDCGQAEISILATEKLAALNNQR